MRTLGGRATDCRGGCSSAADPTCWVTVTGEAAPLDRGDPGGSGPGAGPGDRTSGAMVFVVAVGTAARATLYDAGD